MTVRYPFTGRDAAAVTRLLAMAPTPIIEAAWGRALRSEKYPLVRSLPELVANLNHFVGEPTKPRDAPKVYPEGRTRL